MKKLLILTLTVGTLLASCSKKSSTTPTTPSNTVTINGTAYSTVTIGTQTWTTVNYNGNGGVNYNNGGTNNPTYGKLYTLAEAQAITLPTGWHLPTQTDISTLLTYLGAKGTSEIGVDGDSTVSIKLKSKTAWTFNEGNNSSGFNAYPVGVLGNGSFSGINEQAEFWTSTADAYSDEYTLNITNLQDGPNVDNIAGLDYVPVNSVTTFGLSIRFVKNN
jgi:uncharacterized protein (TIGR02145 family)